MLGGRVGINKKRRSFMCLHTTHVCVIELLLFTRTGLFGACARHFRNEQVKTGRHCERRRTRCVFTETTIGGTAVQKAVARAQTSAVRTIATAGRWWTSSLQRRLPQVQVSAPDKSGKTFAKNEKIIFPNNSSPSVAVGVPCDTTACATDSRSSS